MSFSHRRFQETQIKEASERKGHKTLRTLMKRSCLWYLPGAFISCLKAPWTDTQEKTWPIKVLVSFLCPVFPVPVPALWFLRNGYWIWLLGHRSIFILNYEGDDRCPNTRSPVSCLRSMEFSLLARSHCQHQHQAPALTSRPDHMEGSALVWRWISRAGIGGSSLFLCLLLGLPLVISLWNISLFLSFHWRTHNWWRWSKFFL